MFSKKVHLAWKFPNPLSPPFQLFYRSVPVESIRLRFHKFAWLPVVTFIFVFTVVFSYDIIFLVKYFNETVQNYNPLLMIIITIITCKFQFISVFFTSEFRDAFKIFDVDNSQTITTDELLLVMKNLGMMATKEEVKEMLSEVDEDGMHFKFSAGVDNIWNCYQCRVLYEWRGGGGEEIKKADCIN